MAHARMLRADRANERHRRLMAFGSLGLPRGDEAEVPEGKIEDYLLALHHPAGRAKAEYLISRGYRPGAPEVLKGDLKRVGRTGRVRSAEATDWAPSILW